MHLTDMSVGAIGSFAIIGAHLPIAAGSRFAAQYMGPTMYACASSGTAPTNIGAFHEAMNLAAVWKLPAIFVCENNLYGEYSPIATDDPDRAAGRSRRGLRDPGGPDRRQGRSVWSMTPWPRLPPAARRRGADDDRGADIPPQGPFARLTRRPTGRGRARAWLERDPIPAAGAVLRRRRVELEVLERLDRHATRRDGVDEHLTRAIELARPGPRDADWSTYSHEHRHIPGSDKPRRWAMR